MPAPKKASDESIIDLIRKGLTCAEISRQLGYETHSISRRINSLARQHGLEVRRGSTGSITTEEKQADERWERLLYSNGARKQLSVTDGVVLIGSDAHYWPDLITTAHRAFLRFADELKPAAVIMNGDGFDGASISRFPRIGWDSKPTVAQELAACKERMDEIEAAARTKQLYWPLGNHDSRFETFLAAKAPEYQGVDKFHLKDHFPMWKPCWSVWINDNTVVKHRFKGGLHAPHNNTLWAGRSMVTGHLHSPKVVGLNDYNGTRYGVDCGTLADPYGPQFVDYTEDSPVNWRSAFGVLTYWKGRLLYPELVQVVEDGKVEFRGQVIGV